MENAHPTSAKPPAEENRSKDNEALGNTNQSPPESNKGYVAEKPAVKEEENSSSIPDVGTDHLDNPTNKPEDQIDEERNEEEENSSDVAAKDDNTTRQNEKEMHIPGEDYPAVSTATPIILFVAKKPDKRDVASGKGKRREKKLGEGRERISLAKALKKRCGK